MSKYAFVNPYNFVPLQKEAPQKDAVEKGSYSGVIEYSLLTKTPLFIPNTSSEDAFRMNIEDHKSYDFFSYKDLSEETESVKDKYPTPVIPGSSVRGVLRSNYEVLTNSCMSAIDDEDVLSKRTNETFKPGLLKKEGESFILYKADDHLLRTKGENSLEDDIHWADDEMHNTRKCYRQKDLREGQKVFFTKMDRTSTNQSGRSFAIKPLALNVSDKPERGKTTGYVIKGEDGPDMNGSKQQKHACHIFALKGEYKKLSKEETGTLDKVLDAYKNNAANEYREYAAAWKEYRNGTGSDYFPVYYSSASGTADSFVMLSPACITREIYQNRLSMMIPKHKSCDNKDKLCPACRLFGTLGKKFQVISRVRMSDLVLSGEEKDMRQLFDDVTTLEPLGNPKINNMEFYMQRPAGAWFWTWDYYIDRDGNVKPIVPMINGRKFFWHQMKVNAVSQEPSNLNATIRPLKPGVTFSGKIYFENLSKKELDELCYVIECGDKEELSTKKHGYKLGHAKPLGYGSVALHLDKVVLKKVIADPEKASIRFLESEYDEVETPTFDSGTKQNFMKYTDFELLKGEQVHYPKPQKLDKEGNYPIFAWFADNHKGYDRRKSKEVKMPNSRQQMVFAEYMEAMEPGLKKTGIPINDGNNAGRPANGNYSQNRNAGNSSFSGDKLNEEGKVKNISEKGFAFLTTDQGDLFVHKNAFDGGEFDKLTVGTTVRFKRGMGTNGREQAVKAVII